MPSFLSNFYEKAKNKEIVAGYTLISMAVFLNILFGYFAMIFAFYLSFFEWDYIGKMHFVGLRNFEIMFRDLIRGMKGAPYLLSPFYTGLKNTLLYTLIVVPTQTILAIILAAFANQKIKGQQFFKVSYFLPATTSSVIISLIFIWLFMRNGFINYVLVHVIPGFHPIDWIHDRRYLLYAISLVAIWGTSGHFMVSFLAAMQAIPREIYEAAMLDGPAPLEGSSI